MPRYVANDADKSTSLDIYASSVEGTNTSSVKNTLSFIVVEYDKFGQMRDIKPFGRDLLPCWVT